MLYACGYGAPGGPLPVQYDNPGVQGDIDFRELLLAMGYPEEELDMLEANNVSLESIYNQSRFNQYPDKINNSQPIGDSGNIIAPQYYGGIYYDDKGILTVIVLDQAFSDAASAAAIAEMQALGIIVRTAAFTDQQLNAAMSTLNALSDRTVNAGACSWGLDSQQNRVTVWLDPFTDAQKALFMKLLVDASIDPAMIAIVPAVTPEMSKQRETAIASAMQSDDDRITHVETAAISSTSIKFSLENRTDLDFFYGAQWDMAYNVDGRWMPVQHLPGQGGGVWNSLLYSLQSGDSEQFEVDWEWRFGELPPGRYVYIFDGYFGEYSPDHEIVYVTVEFTIAEAGPGYTSFIALLVDNGFQPTETGTETDSFLSVPERPVFIDDYIITIFEYSSNALMEADAGYIDASGLSIRVPGKEAKISWVSYPHFFKKDTLIINFVGENERILDFLYANLGKPFAGYSYVN